VNGAEIPCSPPSTAHLFIKSGIRRQWYACITFRWILVDRCAFLSSLHHISFHTSFYFFIFDFFYLFSIDRSNHLSLINDICCVLRSVWEVRIQYIVTNDHSLLPIMQSGSEYMLLGATTLLTLQTLVFIPVECIPKFISGISLEIAELFSILGYSIASWIPFRSQGSTISECLL